MRINTFLLLFALCLGTMGLNAQTRTCAAHDIMEQQNADPKIANQRQQIEQFTQSFVASNPNSLQSAVITIPIVFHVVYRTAAENISDAQIMSQLQVLNDDFRRLNGDASNTPSDFACVAADIEIEFCLAQVDPDGNPTTGITRTSTTVNGFGTNDAMKFDAQGGKDAWPACDYLNFWICEIGGGILGYAQFPGGAADTDGVVNAHNYTGNIGTATAPYDLGRTATHEVGHWLNLRHIWGDGNCNADDFVTDTPNAGASNGTSSPCTYPGPNSCTDNQTLCDGTRDYADMFQNYMDYSADACMNLFTEGQKTRMLALFAPGGDRACLLGKDAVKCTVIEDFEIAATPTDVSVCQPDNAVYTVNVTASGGFTGNVSLSATGVPAGATATFSSTTVTGGSGSSTLTVTSAGVAPGTYTITIQGAGTPGTQTTTVDFTVLAGAPGAVTLISPADAATAVSTAAPLSWNAATDAVTYEVEVATDAGFSNIVYSNAGVTGTSTNATGLSINTTYFWRVRAVNPCGISAWSTIWSFTTQDVAPCAEYTTGPFTDFNPLPSACFNDCTPVTQTFEVYQNESYVFYNMVGSEEYTFDFCNGYSAATWEALITVAQFDVTAGAVVAGTEFATTTGCTITFTVPSDGDYVLAISDPNNCGGPTVATDNGFPTLSCTGLTSCCGATFTDPGGPADYANSTNSVTTLCPDFPGQMIEVDFTAFSLEDGGGTGCYDYLNIYDGNSTAAPQIGGLYCDAPNGPGSPGTVTSTSADGCLTFEFISDGSVAQAGWEADVSCIGGGVLLSPKVFLQGPLSGTTMSTDLTAGSMMLPTTSPYADAKTATAAELAGMVDWVYVELRDAATGLTVLEAQSGLLKPDGTVVDTNGTALPFSLAAGSYHVAIHHRNHLGIMTANPIMID